MGRGELGGRQGQAAQGDHAMSTRCNIHFCAGREVRANIYRHQNGYPSLPDPGGVDADLKEFFAAVREQCGAVGKDPERLATQYVVWQAAIYAEHEAELRGHPLRPLSFLSVYVVTEDAGGIEYVWTVRCDERDAEGLPVVTWEKILR